MKSNWLRVSVAMATALVVVFAIGAGCATNSKDAKSPAKAPAKAARSSFPSSWSSARRSASPAR